MSEKMFEVLTIPSIPIHRKEVIKIGDYELKLFACDKAPKEVAILSYDPHCPFCGGILEVCK